MELLRLSPKWSLRNLRRAFRSEVGTEFVDDCREVCARRRLELGSRRLRHDPADIDVRLAESDEEDLHRMPVRNKKLIAAHGRFLDQSIRVAGLVAIHSGEADGHALA